MMLHKINTSIFIVFIALLFVGTSAVFAQTAGFTEPEPSQTLYVPLTTSASPQAVNSALGIGISNEALIPENTTLYVQGTFQTLDNESVSPEVVSALSVGDGTALTIQGSQVRIGSTTCPNNSRVCVIDSTGGRPAVDVIQETGIGMFGETSTAGMAGVYGQGYYGVQGYAANASSIPVVGQSCTELQGSSGVCLDYGTAGFFDGNFVVDPTKGVITGDGRNLYRVQSLFNLNEDVASLESKGVAYKTFGLITPVVVDDGNFQTLSDNLLNPGEVFVGMYVAVQEIGSTEWRASSYTALYDEASNDLMVGNNSGAQISVRIVVSYLLPL